MIWENRLQKIPIPIFIIIMTLLTLILKVGLYVLVDAIYQITRLTILNNLSSNEVSYNIDLVFITSALVIAPLGETVLGQWLPIVVARRFTNKAFIHFIFSVFVFAALHDLPAFLTGIGVGSVLTYTFLLKEKVSVGQAFYTTIIVHALHNLSAVLLFLFLS